MTSTPVSRSPAPPSRAARPRSVCFRLRGGAGRTPTGSPTPGCTAPASTSTGSGSPRWPSSIRPAGGSTSRTRSTTACMRWAGRQWDVVTLDPFTSLVDRCAEDIGLWCQLARRLVVLGTLHETPVWTPLDGIRSEIRKRSDNYAWRVLRRAGAMTMRPLITINEVCEYLGVSRNTLYRMMSRGELTAYRVGRAISFSSGRGRSMRGAPSSKATDLSRMRTGAMSNQA